MSDSEEKAASTNGWPRAILPNPFDFSEKPQAPFATPGSDETSQQGEIFDEPFEVEPRSVSVLRAYVPNFAGELPKPVPTLGDYDEPLMAVPIAENDTSDALSQGPRRKLATIPSNLRGIGLLGAVFEVLSGQLGDEYSTADLMRAAQQLIDIAKSEYVGPVHRDTGQRAGYYSWDLAHAFSAHPWHIARTETHLMDHCDTDEFSPESFESAKFLIEGRGELTWDF